jgi:hypothetical protein
MCSSMSKLNSARQSYGLQLLGGVAGLSFGIVEAFGLNVLARERAIVVPDGGGKVLHKQSFIERFRQVADCPCTDGEQPALLVRIGGEQDDGRLAAPVIEPLLKIETAQAGHLQIRNHTGGLIGVAGQEKLLG